MLTSFKDCKHLIQVKNTYIHWDVLFDSLKDIIVLFILVLKHIASYLKHLDQFNRLGVFNVVNHIAEQGVLKSVAKNIIVG